jgi:hypothetical protein
MTEEPLATEPVEQEYKMSALETIKKYASVTAKDSIEVLLTVGAAMTWTTFQIAGGYVPSLEEIATAGAIANIPADLVGEILVPYVLGDKEAITHYLEKFKPDEKLGNLRPILQVAREFVLEPLGIRYGVPFLANNALPSVIELYNKITPFAAFPSYVTPENGINIFRNPVEGLKPQEYWTQLGQYLQDMLLYTMSGTILDEITIPILYHTNNAIHSLTGFLDKGFKKMHEAEYS